MQETENVDYAYFKQTEGRTRLLTFLNQQELVTLKAALGYIFDQIEAKAILTSQNSDEVIFSLSCPSPAPAWWDHFNTLRNTKHNLLQVLFSGNIAVTRVVDQGIDAILQTQNHETLPPESRSTIGQAIKVSTQETPTQEAPATPPTFPDIQFQTPTTNTGATPEAGVVAETSDYDRLVEEWCNSFANRSSVIYTRWTPGISTITEHSRVQHGSQYPGYQFAWPQLNEDDSQAQEYLYGPALLLASILGGRLCADGTGIVLITDTVRQGNTRDSDGRTINRKVLDRLITEKSCVCSIALAQGADQTGRGNIVFQYLVTIDPTKCDAFISALKEHPRLAWDLALRSRPGLFDTNGWNSRDLNIKEPKNMGLYDFRNLENVGLDSRLVQAAKTGSFDPGTMSQYPQPTLLSGHM